MMGPPELGRGEDLRHGGQISEEGGYHDDDEGDGLDDGLGAARGVDDLGHHDRGVGSCMGVIG